MISIATAALILTTFAGQIVALPTTSPGLSLKVSAPPSVNDVDTFKLTTTLVNTGSETLRLLNDPNSVLTPNVKTPTFDISSLSTGASPAFMGIYIKWSAQAAAAAKHYTILAPGQTLVLEHDLAGRFNFEGAGPGAYRITPFNTFTAVSSTGELSTIEADIGATPAVSVSGKLAPTTHTAPEPASLGKRASFESCSSVQITAVTSAISFAQAYADNAYKSLTGMTSANTASAGYIAWFGAWDSSRKATVQSHFDKIRTSGIANYTYNCSNKAPCDSDSWAWVDPNKFGVVNLCSVFWTSYSVGRDSQAGTIVHESSHFTRNGGTLDQTNGYGQDNCRALAKNNPAAAVMNGDSHEYFVENN